MAKKSKPYDNYDGSKSFGARLQELVEAWQYFARESLKKRQELLKLRASGYYETDYGKWHVLNLIDRGVSTIVPFLVEGNPKIMVDTRVLNYRPWAYTTSLALNYLIEKMKLAQDVLIPAAVNSMFGAAITRTDYYYDRIISLEDDVIKLGTPKVEIIDDSNYIGDPSAKRRSDFTFEGDIYILPTEYAKDFFAGKDKYGNEIADYIVSDGKLVAEFSPKDITNPNFSQKMLSLRDYTTFMDIYLRDEGTIVTLMPKGKKAKILREREWDGPGDGPYDYLGYNFMPEFPIPIPPAWLWHDMDVTANIVANKIRELVENQKDIIATTADGVEDVKKAVKAPNIGTVVLDDPDNSIKQLSINGLKDKSNWEYLNFILIEQTKQGANPDVLAGRGSQAPTFGQEQMLYNNATRVVNNMNTRYQEFVTSIIKKLAWFIWTDPSVEIPVIKEVSGVSLPAVFTEPEKVADFYEFVFDIVPYSTQRTSPEMQYQKIMQFMSQWILPTMTIAQSQGAQLDIPTATKMLAEYLGIKNLNQFYMTTVPQPGETVNYQMQPSTKRQEQRTRFPQASDAFGTTMGNQINQGNRQAEESNNE